MNEIHTSLQQEAGNHRHPDDSDRNENQSSDDHDEINDDGRIVGHWETRWPKEARKLIFWEAVYISAIFVLTLVALLLTWRGDIYSILSSGCQSCGQEIFSLFSFIFLGGMLGGVLFGVKYLYKVVARGYWNRDRRLWRVFSPFLSGGLALAIGALLHSGLLGVTPQLSSNTYYFSLGFITGYFADRALGKMQEIATTIFGNPG